jgi:hypothetical protein
VTDRKELSLFLKHGDYSMKCLFTVNGIPFDKKMDAKAFRNVHGGVVSKGKDHKDFGKNKKTHYGSQPPKNKGDGYPKKR